MLLNYYEVMFVCLFVCLLSTKAWCLLPAVKTRISSHAICKCDKNKNNQNNNNINTGFGRCLKMTKNNYSFIAVTMVRACNFEWNVVDKVPS